MNTEIITLIQGFLDINQFYVYLVLFWWAFFDAIIWFNLFIYWEIFFLAGWILAWFGNLNIHVVFFVSIFWVILWDNFSYLIWKYFWKRLFKEHKKIFTLKLYSKGKRIFDKYWDKSVFLARIFWIFSWVTPFLAWMFRINYRRFFIYDFLWSVIWIWQFILIWYYLWYNYESVINLINNYFVILFLIIFGIFLLLFAIKKTKLKFMLIDSKRKFFAFIIKYFAFYVLIISVFYIVLAYCLFFIFIPLENKNFNNDIYKINHKIEKIISNYKLEATEDKDGEKIAQKINVIYIWNDLEKNMEASSWVKNMNFSDKKMNFFKYTYLTFKKTPPVSDQYFFWKKQDLAFQSKKATLTERNHIRFWHIWFTGKTRQKIYVGAVSLDNWATLKFYKYLIVPFHSVDINLDKARDLLLEALKQNTDIKSFLLEHNSQNISNNIIKQAHSHKLNFITDNKILILKEK